MQTHANNYLMDPRTLRDPSSWSHEGPQESFSNRKIQNKIGLFDQLLIIIGKGKINANPCKPLLNVPKNLLGPF